MKKYLSRISIVIVIFMFLACNNHKDEKLTEIAEKDSLKQENKHPADSSMTLTCDSTVNLPQTDKHFEDTVEDTYYSINYLEDFRKFRSPEQVENYFGKDNVKFQLYNFGPASSIPTSCIFPESKSQVRIVWKVGEMNDYSFGYVTSDYYNYPDSSMKGKRFAYKSGLKSKMSLQELVELNHGPVEFYDFAFSLGRQEIVGMVMESSLREGLKDYMIYLDYKLPKPLHEYPADYLYLEQFKTAWSNNDSVNVSKIYVSNIKYCPCRCIFYGF